MEREGRGLENARARGNLVDGGSSMDRGNIRSRLHLGVDWLDGGINTQRGPRPPMPGLGSGKTAAADVGAGAGAGGAARYAWPDDGNAPCSNRGSIDEARRTRGGDDNHDGEDDAMMRNNSTKEGSWRGLVNSDIYHVWNHGPKFEGGFHCHYCNLKSRGGGATRFREHLGCVPGDVRECPNVPRNVRDAMRDSRDEKQRKKREKAAHKLRVERGIIEGMYQRDGVITIEDDEDEQIQMAVRERLRDKNISCAVERRFGSGRGVRVSLGKQSITTYFDKELSSNKVSMQPKISTALDIESKDVLGQAWAKFFQANDIAGRKANCPYFRAAVKITQNLGPAPVPTAREIDGIYLDKNYEEAGEWLKLFKQDWKNYGVTVMCDSWTGPTGMCLINFMVYCNAQMFFLKSIDASGQTQNSDTR